MNSIREICLEEYKVSRFAKGEIREDLAQDIWEKFGSYIDIEEPGFKNNQQWEIMSKGWVGYLPLGDQVILQLQPKVVISNIFQMLEYAYRLDFKVYEEIFESNSIDGFYESLAKILSLKILDRKRKGLYKSYIDELENLPFVRGKIRFQDIHKRPWQVKLPVEYDIHTSDISDNQLLAWTLHTIIRTKVCSEEGLAVIRKAYRELQRVVKLTPFSARDCINRLYDRLNQDYQPMHALCRFFLDNVGPTIHTGDREMIPFLINMSQLYESFVAEWLRENLPDEYQLESQHKVKFGHDTSYSYTIDLVINDSETGEPVFVLDTKYKTPEKPSNADINQIVAYGEIKGCNRAVLIYPEEFEYTSIGQIGDISVNAYTFGISGDLKQEGAKFLNQLLSDMG